MSQPSFLLVTCQVGAEQAVKHELAETCPDFRFSYSRPGFLTFKIEAAGGVADDFRLQSVFARAYALSLGRAEGATPEERAASVFRLAGDLPYKRLHVWSRDAAAPGFQGYEPGVDAEAEAALAHIRAAWPEDDARRRGVENTAPARPGQLVLDCVLVGPDEWWLGRHRASTLTTRWPGGMKAIELPADAVSRAYLKMEEALIWSQFPLKAGERITEIGCAPGGASQALLHRGLRVLGVDPAVVDPLVAGHAEFTHLRKRGAEVRRREFRKIRWLAADMNVAPQYTLDTVEAIVTHPGVRIRGLLITLKLLDWQLAAEAPAYLERVRSWGYADVRARQLQHNRQEICVAALENRDLRLPGRRRAGKRRAKASPENSISR